MRFRPNRRASNDHAPGPIIAIAPPSRANTRFMDELSPAKRNMEISEMASSDAETGVQSPTANSAEHVAAIK